MKNFHISKCRINCFYQQVFCKQIPAHGSLVTVSQWEDSYPGTQLSSRKVRAESLGPELPFLASGGLSPLTCSPSPSTPALRARTVMPG